MIWVYTGGIGAEAWKSQSTVANKLRLLKLPDKVKSLLVKEELTERHARALLKLPTKEEQEKNGRRNIEERSECKAD